MLDPACPLDWAHPVNAGLTGCWTVPPLLGWRGGLTFRNLTRGRGGSKDGILSGVKFVGAKGRPGGYGGIYCTGGSGFTIDMAAISGDFTFALWIYPVTLTSGFDALMDDAARVWSLFLDTSGNRSFSSGPVGIYPGTSQGLATGHWWHLVGTQQGSTKTVYVNGQQVGTTGGSADTAVATTVSFGPNPSGGGPFDGIYDDLRRYDRALSGAEAFTVFDQSRRGYPDAWRWVKPWSTGTSVLADIIFDAVSNSGYQSAASTYSWSHTCTGANRFLAVDIGRLGTPGSTVSSITYNGVGLTKIGSTASGTDAGRVELWGLANPATGTNTIAVTLSAAVASAGTAVSYANVHQSVPTEAYAGASATNVGAADATVNVTTVAANDWLHAAVATDDTSVTAGLTTRNNVSGVGGSVADEDTGPIASPGSNTASYTGVGALATWTIGAYALRPTYATSPSGAGSGTAAGQAMATGSALRRVNASGTAAGQATCTGSALRRVNASGTAAGHATVAGTAFVSGTGSGTAAGQATCTGSALRRVNASGTAAGHATCVGIVTRLHPASGTAAGQASVAGVASNNQGSGAAHGQASCGGAAVRRVNGSGTVVGSATVRGSFHDGSNPNTGPPCGLLLAGVGR